MWAPPSEVRAAGRQQRLHASGLSSASSLRTRVLYGSAIALAMVAGAVIVYLAGGTKSVYPHLLYVPILSAAYAFGIPGALVVAVGSGLLLGPLMPLDRVAGVDQAAHSWMYRLAFFVAIGGLTAGLMETRNRLHARQRATAQELYHAYGKCLTTFASLVSMRDEPTAHHCERVAANAVTLGRVAGLDEQSLKELYWEGILHDLGKVATPADILLKPGQLTPGEYDEIKKHAKLGADILESISDRFQILADGVRSHHERWDGSGYPDGLAGTDIPLKGRILAIVDVFEAITSDRPYRSAMSPAQGVEVIYQGIGTHFDPELAHLFLDLLEHGRILVQGDPVPIGGEEAFPVPGYAALRRDTDGLG